MKTALLIDDEIAFCELFGQYLETEGWRVFTADDGQRGLELAWSARPDVVVCDLHMPGCNGFQVCKSLRERRDLIPNLRIVVTTGSNYPTDRRIALDAGADEYVVKPVHAKKLAALLDRVLAADAKPVATVAPGGGEAAAARSTPVAFEPSPAALAYTGPPLVRFWGVRGSIPCPGPGTVQYGGNTSCVEVRADGEIVILDAGSGIRGLGKHLTAEFGSRPLAVTLLITHTHWDHIQGFPFFGPAYSPRNSVRILGYEGARKGLQSALSSQMESSYFPIGMKQMPGNILVEEMRDLEFSIGRVRVAATFVNHPGICMGYRLFTSAGSVVYIPDNEPFQRLRSFHESHVTIAEAMRYASSQDQRLIEFIQGAEVLITDAQYDDSEYQSHVGWGHSCVEDVVALALMGRVKRLFLFHHDPEHEDAQIARMTEWARELVRLHGESLEVDAAREGVAIELAKPK
jgi:phosphoribosyl 1,2-cyclic phosphodiesterase/CheY-like chemotaxis protein